ncbi:hypothetical protein EDB85DRAFT_1982418 [Lactarius pseudohatsudake]|nr:hypothetical protein EDB85DRAFT_1982418 [Lactarius pseudohatsudake]
MGLVLFQVDIDPTPHEGKIRELRAPDDARIMDGPMELIQQLWPVEPTKGHLHICVRLPSALGKRKVEDETERGKSFKLARTELHKPDSSIEPNKLQAARDLYDIVWGHPLKEVVLTVRSQQDVWEYVPLENVEKLGLNFLGFTGRVLLFRQEYITAFDLLGLGPSMRREDSVVITGHSGIGKTIRENLPS